MPRHFVPAAIASLTGIVSKDVTDRHRGFANPMPSLPQRRRQRLFFLNWGKFGRKEEPRRIAFS
jgi:hypothetical protein